MHIELIEQYLAAWESTDSPPDVFEILGRIDAPLADKITVLREDIHRRWRLQEPIPLEGYVAKVHGLRGNPSAVVQLVETEFRSRAECGEQPLVSEYTERFPAMAETIKIALLKSTDFSNLDRTVQDESHEQKSHADSGFPDTVGTPLPVPLPESPVVERYRLISSLGSGSFGEVHLAFDEELHREVAVKIPHGDTFRHGVDVQEFLAEARTVARLDHPNIVPVYDVVRQGEQILVVSKCIDGPSLDVWEKKGVCTPAQIATLVRDIAYALGHAHSRSVIHRDVKPANILIDGEGVPHITDFGLAISCDVTLPSGGLAGSPAYMSPEQASGEGHRIGHATDIFSLGVVLYELLTGQRPFRGETVHAILESIAQDVPQEPSTLRMSIPLQLNRICCKAISKRISDRYSDCAEFAKDLDEWQSLESFESTGLLKPRGLRAFESDDAAAFLFLLPGSRDRHGIPESVSFWTQRINEQDPQRTFAIGLLIGPSGCGKSSLIRAGVLPRIGDHVRTIYVEAALEETEARILRGLRHQFPELTDDLSLVDSLALTRRGDGPKVVIFIDQFEQHLNGSNVDANSSLARALRQSDGGRVQTVLMTRDDFGMVAARFMQSVDVPLVDGENFRTVDLLDAQHAKRVLVAFGQALGKLDASEMSATADEFVDKVVDLLARHGKVVCVHLAILVEMLESKEWSPETLESIGSAEGLGVQFLEENLGRRVENPSRRRHEEAVRAVLESLLPPVGDQIKGQVQSLTQVADACGYDSHSVEFSEVMRLLDNELRIITQVIKNDEEDDAEMGYHLTHDFLVPTLRSWLFEKQRETREGRAALLLAERAALWDARRERRYLPSLIEWLTIERFVPWQRRDDRESRLMKHTRARYARNMVTWTVVFLAVLSGLLVVSRERSSQRLIDELIAANLSDVPTILARIDGNDSRLIDRIRGRLESLPDGSRAQERLSMALAGQESVHLERVARSTLDAPLGEFPVRLDILANEGDGVNGLFWSTLRDDDQSAAVHLRSAVVLARHGDADDLRWIELAGRVVDALVSQPVSEVEAWSAHLKSVREHLIPRLGKSTEASRVVGYLLNDDPNELLKYIRESQLGPAFAMAQAAAANDNDLDDYLFEEWTRVEADENVPAAQRAADLERRLRFAVALIGAGAADRLFESLDPGRDGEVANLLVTQIPRNGVPRSLISYLISPHRTAMALRVALLTLSEYCDEKFSLPIQNDTPIIESVTQIYSQHPDGGVHSAARIVLERAGLSEIVHEIDSKNSSELASREPGTWFTNSIGQTFVVGDGPQTFLAGSGVNEPGHTPDAERFQRQFMGRRFAISTTEVTAEQYSQFVEEVTASANPIVNVSWFDAARFCRWLSEKEGIPREEMCYPAIEEIIGGVELADGYLDRSGYRLPTDAEFEYAARNGTDTPYHFGSDPAMMTRYGNFEIIVQRNHVLPVTRFLPSGNGLFGVHGNVNEWTVGIFKGKRPFRVTYTAHDHDSELARIHPETYMSVRGGRFSANQLEQRSAARRPMVAKAQYADVGFRIARTLKLPEFEVFRTGSRLETDAVLNLNGNPGEYVVKVILPDDVKDESKNDVKVVQSTVTVPGQLPVVLCNLELGAFALQFTDKETKEVSQIRGQYGVAKTKQLYVNGIGMRMAHVKPGKFLMGSSSEQIERLKSIPIENPAETDWESPQHEVELTKSIYVGLTEVTVSQFRQFVDETSYVTTAEKAGGLVKGLKNGGWRSLDVGASWRDGGVPKEPTKAAYVPHSAHPVVMVSWNDANAFCRWLSEKEGQTYRLPTEAEWEYFARGGTTTAWCAGDQEVDSGLHGWTRSHGGEVRHVGLKAPNPFGLFDIHGNVSEWCSDIFSPTTYSPEPQVDPTGPPPTATAEIAEHVLRGGGLLQQSFDCRAARRQRNGKYSHSNTWGFRVVAELSKPKQLAASFRVLEKRFVETYEVIGSGGDLRVLADGNELPFQYKDRRQVEVQLPDPLHQSRLSFRSGEREVHGVEIIRPREWKAEILTWDGGPESPTQHWDEIVARGGDTRMVKDINVDWHNWAPGLEQPSVFFAMRARAKFETRGGRHEIALEPLNFGRLYVDDALVIDVTLPATTDAIQWLDLSPGEHSIRIETFHFGDGASVQYAIRRSEKD